MVGGDLPVADPSVGDVGFCIAGSGARRSDLATAEVIR